MGLNDFDLEKVERVQCFAPFKDAFGPGGGESVVVDESDYDKLLELWRNQAKELMECYKELGI